MVASRPIFSHIMTLAFALACSENLLGTPVLLMSSLLFFAGATVIFSVCWFMVTTSPGRFLSVGYRKLWVFEGVLFQVLLCIGGYFNFEFGTGI